jgi:hypothetical protein
MKSGWSKVVHGQRDKDGNLGQNCRYELTVLTCNFKYEPFSLFVAHRGMPVQIGFTTNRQYTPIAEV